MTLTEFFNPYRIEHLKAYAVAKKTGFWPKDFIPSGITIDTLWQVAILGKMADAWIEQVKAGHVQGFPQWE
jgi:hypothetical protein